MRVILLQNAMVNGIWYGPEPYAQELPDRIAQHLINIGCAEAYESKIMEVAEKKPSPETLSVSLPGQVSQPTIAPKRRGRPPKSLQSTIATD